MWCSKGGEGLEKLCGKFWWRDFLELVSNLWRACGNTVE